MKKKLFAFAFCIIMVVAIAVHAFAAEPPQWSEGDTTVIDLTYEEFIKKTAELNGISEMCIRDRDSVKYPLPTKSTEREGNEAL